MRIFLAIALNLNTQNTVAPTRKQIHSVGSHHLILDPYMEQLHQILLLLAFKHIEILNMKLLFMIPSES